MHDRLGQTLELAAALELPALAEARRVEREMNAKRIRASPCSSWKSIGNSSGVRAAPKAFGVGRRFNSCWAHHAYLEATAFLAKAQALSLASCSNALAIRSISLREIPSLMAAFRQPETAARVSVTICLMSAAMRP